MNKTIHNVPDPTLCEEKGLVTTENFLGNAHHQEATYA